MNLLIEAPYQYSKLHPYLDAILTDIFKRIDVQCNSLLDAVEVNIFGKLIKNDYMKSILQKDFNSENFSKPAYTKKGLTEFGFKQLLIQQVMTPSNFKIVCGQQ